MAQRDAKWIYATIELQELIKGIKTPETIIDIGSNKGQFIC